MISMFAASRQNSSNAFRCSKAWFSDVPKASTTWLDSACQEAPANSEPRITAAAAEFVYVFVAFARSSPARIGKRICEADQHGLSRVKVGAKIDQGGGGKLDHPAGGRSF